MNTPTPIWKTPEFWRGLAAEWRGPWTEATGKGICQQLAYRVNPFSIRWEAEAFAYQFRPPNTGLYFFPLGDRTSRVELCDHIADTLEHEANQTPTAQA